MLQIYAAFEEAVHIKANNNIAATRGMNKTARFHSAFTLWIEVVKRQLQV